ncbi:MAG: DUF928 domain-containing protein [Phormidesmis sp.]
MTQQQFAHVAKLVSLSIFLSVSAVVPASLANSATATGDPANTPASATEQDSSAPRQGIPGRRLGGGTRRGSVFAHASDSLTAITTPDPVSITADAHPALLFYVPEMKSANTVEFVLRDDRDNLVYETTFQLERDAGLVSIDTAEAASMPALGIGKNYQWYFSVVPDAGDRANDVVVYGSIRRVDQAQWLAQQSGGADLPERLAAANPLAQARILYQQANLWHDAALLLNTMRQAEPNNDAIAAEWTQLLESAGFTNTFRLHSPTVHSALLEP